MRNNETVSGAKLKKQSGFLDTMKRLKKNKMAVAGLIIILLMAIISIISPWISPYAYDKTNLAIMFEAPSMAHPFGTDELGRDILSRIMYGGRFSLRIGIISISCAAVAGAAIGSVAGYFGGKSDLIIMRFLDVVQAIPGLVLAIAVSATLGPGFTNCIIKIRCFFNG